MLTATPIFDTDTDTASPIREDEMTPERQAWHDEGVKSWEHYKATGLHLTWEEVEDWLSTWGTDHEKEAPPCHR